VNSILNALLPGVGEVVGKVFDRVFPDPETRARAELEVAKLAQAGEFRQLDSLDASDRNQTEVNKIEAGSDSLWKSGWRPGAGWACVGGLVYQLMFRPIVGWVMSNWLHWTAPPSLEMETLLTLLFGMLGLGAYRTYERVRLK
jgi:hypothetical protein